MVILFTDALKPLTVNLSRVLFLNAHGKMTSFYVTRLIPQGNYFYDNTSGSESLISGDLFSSEPVIDSFRGNVFLLWKNVHRDVDLA